MKKLLPLIVLFAVGNSFAGQPTEAVKVPSLKVKERLQSIELINVSAETKRVEVKVDNTEVKAILAEAEALDEIAEAAQSARH